MRGRRPTPWIRWRTILLVAVLLLPGTPDLLARLHAEHAARDRAAAALAPGRNALPERRERHQAAPPSPSGAYPPYPLNHTFDAEIITLGTAPNHDFEAPATNVGTPPANFDFATGTFADWTPTNAPTIASDATQGSYASLQATTQIETTTAITLDAGMQYVTIRVKGLSASTDKGIFETLSGPTSATVTTAWSATAADSWATIEFFAQSLRGQSVKVRVRNNGGTIAVDDVAVQRAKVPGWALPSTHSLVAGSPSGTAIKIGGTLTTGEIDLPADAQQFSLRYRTSDTSGTGIFWYLLSGQDFATATNLGVLSGASGTWHTARLIVDQHAGDPIKLKFSPQLQQVYLDDVAIVENAVPGWTIDPTYQAAAPGSDADGTYVTAHGSQNAIQLESSPIDPAIVDVPSRVDGHSYTLRYAMGTGGTAAVRAYYDEPGENGQNYQVFVDNAAGTTPRWGRFTLWDWMIPGGRLVVKLTGGGRVYAIAENVARQQLAEPFSQQAGAGIDTSTGSFGTSELDLTVQGGPLPLAFTRYYHGHSDRYGAMGYRWSHTFDAFLGLYGSDVAVVFGSGKEEFFDEQGGTFTPIDARVKSSLTLLSPPVNGVDYRYVTKDRLVYNFEGDGDLISIAAPNGNAITLYRDPTTERITSVTDPGGQAQVEPLLRAALI